MKVRATERTRPHTPGPAASAAFLGALGLCVFTLVALRMPLSSEVRYFESAREMVESGDWIVPHLAYVPYFEKPILLYWFGAASQLCFGESGIAARLPSILSATLSLLLVWDIARRLLGEAGGMQAALLLLSSGYFLVFGSVLTTDTLFSACLLSAWYAWWRAREGHGSLWKWLYCGATALGFMTKGPLALILVGGAIATFQVFQQPSPAGEVGLVRALGFRIVRGLRAALVQGYALQLVLVTLLLNLPWTLAVLRRDPRMLEFFYVRENFKAFFDGSVHHTQGFFYYGGVLLVAFTPWSLPCALGGLVALRERLVAAWHGRGNEALRSYLGAIVIFTLAFLQLSSAKLASYPLPILSAFAILIVDCWRSRLAAPPRWLRWSPLAGAIVSIAGVVVYLLDKRTAVEALDPELLTHFSAALLLVALAQLAGGILVLRGRFWTGILAGCLAFGGLVVIVSARLAELEPSRNVQALAREIAVREQPGDLVVATGHFVHDYTLQLVLRHRIALVGNARELGMGFFAEVTAPDVPIPEKPYAVCAENLPANPWLLTRERLVEELRGKRRVWLVAAPVEVDALLAEGLRLRVVGTLPNARLVTNVE